MRVTKRALVLSAILATALVMRLYLAGREIYGDKIYFVDAASNVLRTGYPMYNDGTPGVQLFAFWHPPLYTFLVALALLLSNGNSMELAVRMIGIVSGLLSITLIYLFGKRMFNERVGFLSAFLAALNPFSIVGNQTVDIDGTILTLFLLLATYFYFKYLSGATTKTFYLSALIFGLALLSKEAAFVLLPSILLLHYLYRGLDLKRFLLFSLIGVGMFSLSLIYTASNNPKWIGDYFDLLFSRLHGVGSPGGKGIYYLDLFGPVGSIAATLWELTPPVALLVSLGFLWSFRKPRNRPELLLAAWVASFVIFFSLTGKIDKYYLPFLPAVFLLSGRTLERLRWADFTPRTLFVIGATSVAVFLYLQTIQFQETFSFLSSNPPVVGLFVLPAVIPFIVKVGAGPFTGKGGSKKLDALLTIICFTLIVSDGLYFTAARLPLDQIGARDAGVYIHDHLKGSSPIISSKDIAFYASRDYYEINYFSLQSFPLFLQNHPDIKIVAFYGSDNPAAGYSSTQYQGEFRIYLTENQWQLVKVFKINYKGSVYIYVRT